MGEIVKFMTGTSTNMYENKDNFSNGTFIFTSDTERFYLKMNDRIVAITPSKEELAARRLKPLLCPCCGHQLDIKDKNDTLSKCEYCGTVSDLDSIYFKEVIECNKRVTDKINTIKNTDNFNVILRIKEKLCRYLSHVPTPIEFTGDYPIFLSLPRDPIIIQFPRDVNDLELLFDTGFGNDESIPKDVKSYNSKLIITLQSSNNDNILAEVYSIGYKEDITKKELDRYLNEFYDIYHKIGIKDYKDALHIIKEEFKRYIKET